jgi:uroporphyrinogen-III synthase
MNPARDLPLHGIDIVITRPTGTAAPLARRVRALGGTPHLLPGLSLRALPVAPARAALAQALHDDVLVFTSPAAVRFAARLDALDTSAHVLGVGQGTLRALHRAGLAQAHAPEGGHQHSEGLLTHPWLADVRGQRVALVTAPGGRGVLDVELRRRGAQVRAVHVYTRQPPRLDRRHQAMLMRLPEPAWVLLTSAQALYNLLAALPQASRTRLLACRAVVGSVRLETIAREAGFKHLRRAASTGAADLLDAVAANRDRR